MLAETYLCTTQGGKQLKDFDVAFNIVVRLTLYMPTGQETLSCWRDFFFFEGGGIELIGYYDNRHNIQRRVLVCTYITNTGTPTLYCTDSQLKRYNLRTQSSHTFVQLKRKGRVFCVTHTIVHKRYVFCSYLKNNKKGSEA